MQAVEVVAGAARTTTDSAGVFRLESLPNGGHLVVARRIGFMPESLSATVSNDQGVVVRFILRAAPTELDRVAVVDESIVPARLIGFEERRKRRGGSAQFITKADIERIMPVATSDLVRRMSGVRLIDSMGVTLAISTRGPKIQMINNRPVPVQCVVRIGVDGQVKEPYFPMNSVLRTDIYGIEVYAGAATLPPEFGGARRDASCGLIMIWTKSR